MLERVPLLLSLALLLTSACDGGAPAPEAAPARAELAEDQAEPGSPEAQAELPEAEASAPALECKRRDLAGCQAACEAKVAAACVHVGEIHEYGWHQQTIDYPAAREAYRRGCELGDPTGCAGVGFGHLTGLGAEEDLAKAHELFKDACARGSGMGCHGMSWIVFDGRREPFDRERIQALNLQGCELGELSACPDAGASYLHGSGVAKDEVKARAYFERGCKGDDHFGCDWLAWAKIEGTMGFEPDPAKGIAELRALCELPAPGACSDLAYLLKQGEHLPQDLPAARAQYEYACEHGGIHACAELGIMLLHGEGGPADTGEALHLLESSCRRNASVGCYMLGRLYAGSPFLPKDLDKAQTYLEQACASEHPWACNELGGLHYNDLDTHPRDVEKAITTYSMSCAKDNMQGCASAGYLLLTRDPARGRELLIEACEGGFDKVCWKASQMLEKGEGGVADPARAVAMLSAACKPEAPRACQSLARAYLDVGHESRDPDKGAQILQELCDAAKPLDDEGKDDPAREQQQVRVSACSTLGSELLSGDHLPPDPARASELMSRACQLGVAHSCHRLGNEYERGHQLDKQPDAALTLLERACELYAGYCDNYARALVELPAPPARPEQGLAMLDAQCTKTKGKEGCGALARIYHHGNANVAEDEAKAIAYYDKACAYEPGEHEYKSLFYCYDAGRMRLKSKDPAVAGQREQAIAALDRSCSEDNFAACNMLADLYQESGTEEDAAKGRAYRDKACKAGSGRSCIGHEGH